MWLAWIGLFRILDGWVMSPLHNVDSQNLKTSSNAYTRIITNFVDYWLFWFNVDHESCHPIGSSEQHIPTVTLATVCVKGKIGWFGIHSCSSPRLATIQGNIAQFALLLNLEWVENPCVGNINVILWKV